MSRHLSLRSGNPALSSKTFKNLDFAPENRMTLDGTVNKTAMSLIILLLTASYTFSNANTSYILFGFILYLYILQYVFQTHQQNFQQKIPTLYLSIPLHIAIHCLSMMVLKGEYNHSYLFRIIDFIITMKILIIFYIIKNMIINCR